MSFEIRHVTMAIGRSTGPLAKTAIMDPAIGKTTRQTNSQLSGVLDQASISDSLFPFGLATASGERR